MVSDDTSPDPPSQAAKAAVLAELSCTLIVPVFEAKAPVTLPLESEKPGEGEVTTVVPLNEATEVPPPLFQLVVKLDLDLAAAAEKPEQVLPLPAEIVAEADVAAVTAGPELVVHPDRLSLPIVVVSFFEYPAELVVGTKGGVKVIVAVNLVQLIDTAGAFLAEAVPLKSAIDVSMPMGTITARSALAAFLLVLIGYLSPLRTYVQV
jgi:hypothetical protein